MNPVLTPGKQTTVIGYGVNFLKAMKGITVLNGRATMPTSRPDPICLNLDREQAEGYLWLLESQWRDEGFKEDAVWLRKQMEYRGWIEVSDADL